MKLDRHRGMTPGEIAREAMHHLIAGKAHLACAAQDIRAIPGLGAAVYLDDAMRRVELSSESMVAFAKEIVSRTAEELPDAGAPVIPSPPDEHGT